MSDATVTELRPSPAKGEGTRRPKDPTSAQRQARFRKKRNAVVTVAPNALSAKIPYPPPHKECDNQSVQIQLHISSPTSATTPTTAISSLHTLIPLTLLAIH